MNDMYRVVVSVWDRVPSSSPPFAKDAALEFFGGIIHAPGFTPDGGSRARVVTDQEWLAIKAAADRRATS